MEDQGKEGNGKYEKCPVEDYVFKLEIIQCLLESPNKTVICEDSKLNWPRFFCCMLLLNCVVPIKQ